MANNQSNGKPENRSRSNRAWIENNQDRNHRLNLMLPKLTHRELREAGEKSGLSMTGLMLAATEFLRLADSRELQELAKRSASRLGVRLQFVDRDTGETRRVAGGPYRRTTLDD